MVIYLCCDNTHWRSCLKGLPKVSDPMNSQLLNDTGKGKYVVGLEKGQSRLNVSMIGKPAKIPLSMVTSLFCNGNQIGFCQEKYNTSANTKLLKNYRGNIKSKAG